MTHCSPRPGRVGAWGDASTARLAGLTAGAALIATGLMHLLVLSTPRPIRFFTWFMALATLIAVLMPFLTGSEPSTKLATAALNAAVGITIGSLVSSVARSAVRMLPA